MVPAWAQTTYGQSASGRLWGAGVRAEDAYPGHDEAGYLGDGGDISGHGARPQGELEGVEALHLIPAQLVDAVHLVVVQGPADEPVDGAAVGVPELVGDLLVRHRRKPFRNRWPGSSGGLLGQDPRRWRWTSTDVRVC